MIEDQRATLQREIEEAQAEILQGEKMSRSLSMSDQMAGQQMKATAERKLQIAQQALAKLEPASPKREDQGERERLVDDLKEARVSIEKAKRMMADGLALLIEATQRESALQAVLTRLESIS